MTPNQVKAELEKQTERIVQELQKRLQDPNVDRIKQIISIGFPDYRTIANKLQFEFF